MSYFEGNLFSVTKIVYDYVQMLMLNLKRIIRKNVSLMH
jgi:hypothetical protein